MEEGSLPRVLRRVESALEEARQALKEGSARKLRQVDHAFVPYDLVENIVAFVVARQPEQLQLGKTIGTLEYYAHFASWPLSEESRHRLADVAERHISRYFNDVSLDALREDQDYCADVLTRLSDLRTSLIQQPASLLDAGQAEAVRRTQESYALRIADAKAKVPDDGARESELTRRRGALLSSPRPSLIGALRWALERFGTLGTVRERPAIPLLSGNTPAVAAAEDVGGAEQTHMVERSYPTDNDVGLREEVLTPFASQIRELAARFAGHYMRPSARTIENWLLQFGSGVDRPTAVYRILLAKRLLEQVRFYDHESVARGFAALQRAMVPEKRNKLAYVPMGGPSDSSVLHTYYLGHFSKSFHELRFSGLEEIASLSAADRPDAIVFIDDIIGRGTQSIGILRNWLGLAGDPEYPPALTPSAQELLRTTSLFYHVIIGMKQGIAALKEFCGEASLNMEISEAETRHDSIGCFDTSFLIFDSPADREAAREMAFDIGLATLDSQTAWTEEKRRHRALGYGNSGQLIVFPYNTPTCTLTLLWKAGTYRGTPWVPLFERR
jgi:hypothetical protein